MSKIEERKSTGQILFTDSNGKPLANAKIDYSLSNHKFLFGCNGFLVSDLVNQLGEEDAEKNESVKQFLDVFNFATLAFYWGSFEPEEGKPRTAELMQAAKFLRNHGVTLKGHPLCWHTVCADWLLKYDNKTILEKQIGRIHREVEGFKGIIDMWDAINEVVIMPVFDRYDNAVTRLCREHGQTGLVKKIFDAAKESNQNATLLLNDFNMSPAYEKLIEECLDAGVKIDAIGLQSHQHQGCWGMEKLEDVLSRFERFGLPINFTENTFVSGELVPPELDDLNDYKYADDASTPEGEERQAKWIEEFYTQIFENHPQVTAITNWDFNDGAWLNAPSGLIRRNGTVKPAYYTLKKLIKEKWTTKGTVTTDENGYAQISGFKGEYIWSSGNNDGKFNLL
ncbi:endo-1,4-beta-xylanase [Treponema sp.]|uniref:endo-1,4-beta-xylanase n=1 Tax=Treponema sp. TaxID=166 RepID=UPI00388D238A